MQTVVKTKKPRKQAISGCFWAMRTYRGRIKDDHKIDPACGSGHILVYAFELLAAMYEEAGYSNRDAARLIIEKNLTGLEIDSRAGAMASFALTMKACELDSRFLRRGVMPRIEVLERFEFQPDELALCPNVAENTALLDAVAHLDECGSLLQPSQDDLATIERDLASLAGDSSLFANSAAGKLGRLQAELRPLTERYDVVVANPPYMGSSSLGPWMSTWVKRQYPDEKSDLCTSFIERGFTLSRGDGANAMVTMQSWMFLGSYEKMRDKLLRSHSISSMAHLGTRAFSAIAGEVVSTTATVFCNAPTDEPGAYFRLVDMAGENEKQEGYLEALANPDCGWLYWADTSGFESIPSAPIAYWASDAVISAFKNTLLKDVVPVKKGLDTGDNDRYLRLWHEVSHGSFGLGANSSDEFSMLRTKWAPHDKGGEYRRWYGNTEWVINWRNNGEDLRLSSANLRSEQYYFKTAITWCSLSSGLCSFRYSDYGAISNTAGSSMYPASNLFLYLGLMNSSVVQHLFSFLAPTLNYSAGPVGQIPKAEWANEKRIYELVTSSVTISKSEWDTNEVSWDFRRHSLI